VKTSIYLPDDLAEQVRAFKIAMSEVAQAALRQAVADAEAMAEAKAQLGPDVEVAVARMRGILADEERAREAERSSGRNVGIRWARDYASPRELAEFASSSPPGRVFASHSLHRFCADQPELTRSVERYSSHLVIDITHKPWWAGFHQGAATVWEALRPILDRRARPGAGPPGTDQVSSRSRTRTRASAGGAGSGQAAAG
jgi:post-segregation antitoxin (ccd killing protein)